MNRSSVSAMCSAEVAMACPRRKSIREAVDPQTQEPPEERPPLYGEEPAEGRSQPGGVALGFREHGQDARRLAGRADLRSHLLAVEEEGGQQVAGDLPHQDLLAALVGHEGAGEPQVLV